MKTIQGGVTAAKGFKAGSTAAAIKYKDRTDMAMVYSTVPARVAGTFTTNVVKAACVQWDQKIVKESEFAQAIVVNSGIANACTGKQGFDACEATAVAVKEVLSVPKDACLVASTGVIGMQLPVEKLTNGVKAMAPKLADSLEAGTEAAKAIMTTDTKHKEIAVRFMVDGKEITLGGMAKGSGMIHPNMCTMLAFLSTDLNISKALLQEALSDVVVDSFNMISVDGDTSTNDSLVLLANGMAENTEITEKNQDYETFKSALNYICTELAMMLAGDGEGATALYEVKVVHADTKANARTLAKSVVCSSLSKAAIFGHDANFGRFLCALGYSGVQFNPEDLELYFMNEEEKMLIFKDGAAVDYSEEQATKILSSEKVTVFVDMKMGNEEATAWGCDLSYDYVKINADYRS